MKNIVRYIFLIFSLLSLPSHAQTPLEIISNYRVKPDMTSPSDKSVGGVPVSFDVLQTGAATFSIPVECPKGVNGMQPNVSIGYSSLSGEGYAGWGSSVHGLSLITRGVKTVYYDGAASGRDFSENDALYLDGKRLVQKYGNGIVSGATFVSETDPYSVFTICGSGPEMWICGRLSNGNTVWYGRNIDARQFITTFSDVTVVNAWYLNYVEDRNGNAMGIMYSRDNGTVYPWYISYGRNVKENTEYNMSVTFGYEPRDSSLPYMISGIKCSNSLRLKTIETSCNNKLYRKYSLDYETNRTTHKEKLVSVSVTPGETTEERKINMTWSGQLSNGISARAVDVPETDYYLTEKLNRYFTAVDINGDGVSDILEFAPVKITTSYGASSSSGVLDNYCIPYLSSIDDKGNTAYKRGIYDKTGGYLTEKKTANDDGSYVKTILGDYGYYSGKWMPKTSTTVMKHPDDSQEYTDVTRMEYDDRGNVASTVSHAGTDKETSTDMTYDKFGNVTSVLSKAGPLQTCTTYTEYSKDGRFAVHTYTEPASTDISYTYDNFGNLLTETDNTNQASSLTTTRILDEWGNETETVFPTGKISGVLTKWKDIADKSYFTVSYSNDAPWTKTEYDRLGRELRRETVNAGDIAATTAKEYDRKGNVTSVVIQTGKLSTSKNMTYDESGRLQSETYSSGKTVNYTYGKRKVTVNTNGHSFEKEYDAWGNVKKSTDPIATVEYEYYSNGKTKRATCCGASTEMDYDAAGNRILLEDADAGKITSEYDALGRNTRQQDEQGNVINKSYDCFGRVMSESGATSSVDYKYNAKGQITSAYSGNNSTSIIYDKFGRITMEQRNPEFGEIQISGYKYNGIGQVYEETLPGNIKVKYGYDSYGNLVSRSIGGIEVWKLISDDGKTVRHALLGGKLENVVERDRNGYVSSDKLYFGGKTIDWIKYSFNAITGNLSRKSRKGDTFVSSYSYDAMDRLTDCIPMAQIEIMDTALVAKPLIGNTSLPGDIGVVLPGDRYPMAIGDKYVYADNGNILSTTAIGSYTYDDNRPHAVKTVENKSGSIHSAPQQVVYNNLNLVDGIMEGEGDGMTDLEYYFGTDKSRWHAEYYKGSNVYRTIDYGDGYDKVTENDTIREFWYIGDDILLYRENGGTLKAFYMLTDNVGSIVGIYDIDGKELFRADYDPWGVMTVRRNDIGFIRGYTGHEMLREFNLINMNGRVYDPQSCRFLSPDNYVQEPGNSQSFNRYSYCLNNPLKYNDPSGEYALLDDAIVAILGGTVNLVANVMEGNIHGSVWTCVGKGAAAFVSGAIAGVGGIYPEAGGWAWGGAVVGATNAWLSGESGWGIAKGAAIGTLSSGISSYVGKYLGIAFGSINFASKEITSPILNGLLNGAVLGSACGFVSDFAIALMQGASIEEACNASLNGAAIGGLTGAVFGIGSGIKSARENKVSPWTGEKINMHHSFAKFLGGDPKQELTPMSLGRHQRYHREFNEYLLEQTDEYGNNMRPVKGNSGKVIRSNFDFDTRKSAARQFYDMHPYKYWDARFDFYRTNGLKWQWRPW